MVEIASDSTRPTAAKPARFTQRPATTVFVTATGLVIGARSWVNLAVFAAVGLVLSLAISTILERFLYISIG